MISVLLRTRNEQEHIGFCLQSINDVLGRDTEVLIANNNSTDDTVNIIQMFDWMDIELFDIDAYTPGETLNYLASKSTNNTLLTLSAHCKLLPNENIGPIVFTDFEAARAVFGKQIPIYKGKRITPRYIWSHFGDEIVTNMYSEIEDRHFLHNAFCFYDREYLLDHPFDDKLSGKEDRYWAKDVVDRGDMYLYEPALQVEHYYTKNGATWKGLG
tara:strand:- start:557 stop:1198 length:642 start_codon:yes stop_codon:yes gene_type:complete